MSVTDRHKVARFGRALTARCCIFPEAQHCDSRWHFGKFNHVPFVVSAALNLGPESPLRTPHEFEFELEPPLDKKTLIS